jgi:hypothetical protein
MRSASASSVSLSFSSDVQLGGTCREALANAREAKTLSALVAAIAKTRKEESCSIAIDSVLRLEYFAALADCFLMAQDENDVSCLNWCVVLLADMLPEHDPLTEVWKCELFVLFTSFSFFQRRCKSWVSTRVNVTLM